MMDELLTTNEVAEKLKCSAQTVRKLVHYGKLKATHVGAMMRFKAEYIEEYLRNEENKTDES